MFVSFKTRLVYSKPLNEMNHRKPIYVCIICVFVNVHRFQFLHIHPNLKHLNLSLFFDIYPNSTHVPIIWWTLKAIFCILRKTTDIRKYGNKVWKKIAAQTCEGYPAWYWYSQLNWTYNPKEPTEFLVFHEHPLEMVHFQQ